MDASLQVVGLCFIINAVDGMNVFLMSYLAPSITRDWALSPTTLGEIFSAALVGMAIGGLMIAPLGDRYGRRPLILASLLMMSTGMVLSGFTPGVVALLLARVLVGMGIGTVLACMTALVAEFAPPHRRNFSVGLLRAATPSARLPRALSQPGLSPIIHGAASCSSPASARWSSSP